MKNTSCNHMEGGGDVLYELRNLAIPFVFILAKNGMEYLKSNQKFAKAMGTSLLPNAVKKTMRVTSKPPAAAKAAPKKKKVVKGGGCACTQKNGGKLNEIDKLANNLNTIVNSYGR